MLFHLSSTLDITAKDKSCLMAKYLYFIFIDFWANQTLFTNLFKLYWENVLIAFSEDFLWNQSIRHLHTSQIINLLYSASTIPIAEMKLRHNQFKEWVSTTFECKCKLSRNFHFTLWKITVCSLQWRGGHFYKWDTGFEVGHSKSK